MNKPSAVRLTERERERESFVPPELTSAKRWRAWFLMSVFLIGAAFIIGGGVSNMAKGTSASGTSIPISKGGTGATNKTDALKNLLPDFSTSDNNKVLGLTSGAPAWVNQATSEALVMTPDYANVDPTNLATVPSKTFTTSTSAWTTNAFSAFAVSKTGYLQVYLAMNKTSGVTTVLYIIVNGITVLEEDSRVDAFHSLATVIPVTAGDNVQLAFGTETPGTYHIADTVHAQMIPPKYTNPPTPIVVEGGDYSTSEQLVMVNDNGTQRPKKWIDGKPIYQKTITGLTGPSVNSGSDVSLGIQVDQLIDQEVFIELQSGAQTAGTLFYNNSGDSQLSANVFKASSTDNTLYLRSYVHSSNTVWTNANLTVTVRYTKTTD